MEVVLLFSLVNVIAADERFDTADQLTVGKWFGEIVITSA